MQLQTLKQEIMTSIQKLPDDANIDDIMEQLYIIEKLRKSREAIRNNRTISHTELEREIQQW
ncbi:hypothetical protein TI05_09845 [Achromatium sp. WMS3]|nr:hypothetical protein TI05_09845 [Achromatium sp. WMS3]